MHWLVVIVVVAAFVFGVGFGGASIVSADVIGVGGEVTSLMAKDLASGKQVNIVEGVDKPTIIAFMQSACRACLDEIRNTQTWLNDNPGKVNFILVSVDMAASKELLDGYAKKWKIRGTWYSDPDFAIPPVFGMNFTPGMVILGKDRKVIMIKKGWNSGQAKKFQADLTSTFE